MKSTTKNIIIFIFLLFALALASGCQNRKVTKIVELEKALSQEKETVASTDPQIPTTETTTLIYSSTEANDISDIQPPSSDSSVIILKSEDLEVIDEKTKILNEIDALLDNTLGNIDTLENDSISDDNILETEKGGLSK